MKKLLLSGLALFVGFGAMAQGNRLNQNARLVEHVKRSQALTQEIMVPAGPAMPKSHAARNASSSTVAVSTIGNMPNANGVAFTARRPLFYHPAINTVAMAYRNAATIFGGATGQLRFSSSLDGGATWPNTNVLLYSASGGGNPPFANARYPQAAIYNPIGNTNANNAYVSFFAPDLGNVAAPCGTPFGGSVFGSIAVNGGTATQTEDLTSTDNYIMDDMALNTADNNLWVAQGYYDMSGLTCDYNDSVILRKGVWAAGDYSYSKVLINAPVEVRNNGEKMWEQTRMAWSPNGQIGYVVNMGHESFVDNADSIRYPTVFKTTDAGLNWNRVAALDINMIDSVLGFGQALTEGYEFSCAVGSDNNLHIFMSILPAGSTWSNFYDIPVLCDVFTSDQGNTWTASIIAIPAGGSVGQFYAGTSIGFQEYNRPQISRTLDGSKLFFTWFETDTLIWGTADGNTHPDMWVVGLDVTTGLYTDSLNITTGTDADGSCNFGLVAPLVKDGSGPGCYEIPTAYISAQTTSTVSGITYPNFGGAQDINYIAGGEICAAFNKTLFQTAVGNYAAVGVQEPSPSASFSVSQNYPNPFRGETRFDINVKNNTNGTMDIYNVLGKMVMSVKLDNLTAGVNTITVDASDLASGIYTYTVKIGNEQVTRSLMVK